MFNWELKLLQISHFSECEGILYEPYFVFLLGWFLCPFTVNITLLLSYYHKCFINKWIKKKDNTIEKNHIEDCYSQLLVAYLISVFALHNLINHFLKTRISCQFQRLGEGGIISYTKIPLMIHEYRAERSLINSLADPIILIK